MSQPKNDVSMMSQWQLIRFNFTRHRLAMWSLYGLVLIYLAAVFAEFLSPSIPFAGNLDYQYCPPQLLRWDSKNGLHVRAMKQEINPITLSRDYEELKDSIIPISFFVRGQPYWMWGIFSSNLHFIGVDQSKSENPAEIKPVYFLGADKYGRDLLTRALYGSRVSLSVGLIGIIFTFILGMTIGGISGYVGGATDTFIQRIIEVINSIPNLPLWIALSAVMPAEWSPILVYFAITIVLSLLGWTGLARVVRGKILSLREEDYAMAARLLGASHSRILFKHLLPGFTSHIIVALSLSVPGMILGETSLSFLGIGLRPPIVSWGVMLQDCIDIEAIRYHIWLLTPVISIIVTVLCFNFVGDGLRDAADPYSTR